MDIRRRFALMKLLQLVFGLVTYFMFLSYHVDGALGGSSNNEAFVRLSFGMTTVTAFPFIIIACSVVVYLVNSSSGVESNLLQFLFSIIGFAMYLITGSLVYHYCDSTFIISCSDGVKATAALSLVTSIVYLVEVVFGALDRCR